MINGHNRWLVSGGIGSGKSAVRKILAELGFATIDADSIGHQVLREEEVIGEVGENWPAAVVDGQVDRSALGEIVFSDSGELRKLERITHPRIFGRIQTHVQGISEVVFVEVPLLYHGLGEGWRRLMVDCDDSVRLRRLVSKGVSAADARRRMESQPARGEWLAKADVVVPNHDSLNALRGSIEDFVSNLAPTWDPAEIDPD